MAPLYDVSIVGSGPNGLAAGITLARAGKSVAVIEAKDTAGGACSSAELTLPGFVHDVGSAIHPLVMASPFMQTIDWQAHGVDWIRPEAAVAHPLDNGKAAIVWNDLERTALELGDDGNRYRNIFGRLTGHFDELVRFVMQTPTTMLSQPFNGLRFGLPMALPATALARVFTTPKAKALLAGHAAHAIQPLNRPFTAGFGLLLGAACHAVGWPFPRSGASVLTQALVSELTKAGGKIIVERPVASLADIPPSSSVLFALTPRQVQSIAGGQFSAAYNQKLSGFAYGAGVCKVDYALDAPIPWADPRVGSAATVHVGGTLNQIANAEATVQRGRAAEKPFVLLAQHSLFDSDRAPEGKHTVWAYCHVPNGLTQDVSHTIDAQIERFAPGFSETILHRTVSMPADLELGNANLVGGDIGGGSYAWHRSVFRPFVTKRPYSTSNPSIFIGSSSCTPGAGVHGMAGYHAARAILDGR